MAQRIKAHSGNARSSLARVGASLRSDGYASALGLNNVFYGPWGRQDTGVRIPTPFSTQNNYAKRGLFTRVIDLPPEQAVSGGFEITNDDDVADATFQRIQLARVMIRALKMARLTGGALLAVQARGAGELVTPLPETIGPIERLRVYRLDQLRVDQWDEDPGSPTYGEPLIYAIQQVTRTSADTQIRIHASRTLPVSGDDTLGGDQLTQQDIPWAGYPVTGALSVAIERYEESVLLALEIMRRKQQATHRMQGLADAIAEGQEPLIRQRLALVDAGRNLRNSVAVDGLDDFTVQDLGLGGVQEIINQTKLFISAETGIPATILFGQSPTGQNSTGESDMRIFYDLLTSIRVDKAQPIIEWAVDLHNRQRGVKQVRDWEIEWEPLEKPSAKERSEIERSDAQAQQARVNAITALIDNGILTPEESRAYLESQRAFGLGG